MGANDSSPSVPRPSVGPPPPTTSAGDTRLSQALLQTREVRQVLHAVVPEVLAGWAGESRFRALVAAVVARSVRRGFAAAANGNGSASLQAVLRQPEHARQLAAQVPTLLNQVLDVSAAVSDGVAQLSPEDKARVLDAALDALDPALAGQLLTSLARIVNEARAADPIPLAERLRPAVREWLRRVDFGELKAAVDAVAANSGAVAAMLNEELWQYPTKMVCLLAMLPAAVNAGLEGLTKTVEPINGLAPDLVADVVLSLTRDVDGAAIGRLVNAGCELLRKVHTGSVLIGDSSKPQLPRTLAQLVDDVLRTVDVGLLLKARAALADAGESTETAVIELLEQHPELVRDMIVGRFRERGAGFRRLARTTDLVERTLADPDLAAAVTTGLAEVDAQELADTMNRAVGMLNRVRASAPHVVRDVLVQTIGALDEVEVRDAVGGLVEDVVAALEPIAGEIVPPVIRGLAALLAAGTKEGDEDVRAAVSAVRSALHGHEVVA